MRTSRFAAGDTLLLGRESAGVPEPVHARADARLRDADASACALAQCGRRRRDGAGRSVAADGRISLHERAARCASKRKRCAAAWFANCAIGSAPPSRRSRRTAGGHGLSATRPAASSARHGSAPTMTARRRRRRHHGGDEGPRVRKGRRERFARVRTSSRREFAKEIPGAGRATRTIWATGISLVAHMAEPARARRALQHAPSWRRPKSWFGGGGDLTPMHRRRSARTTPEHEAPSTKR